MSLPERIPQPGLKRVLGLPALVAYGLGTTIGAGIYVLVGKLAGIAGNYGHVSFLVACLTAALPAMAFAEFSGRLPFAAGEARYVAHGTKLAWLGLAAGLAVAGAGLISSAALALGAAGYVSRFLDMPQMVVVLVLVSALAALAAWGIRESVIFAAIITILETGGLLLVIIAGVVNAPGDVTFALLRLPALSDSSAWSAVLAATPLAFFAFIGFEDIVNAAEETRTPHKTLARAIFITLGLTFVIYLGVFAVAVTHAPADELAASRAPLALVAERLPGAAAQVITSIAIVATINGIIIQIIMASRILYGLARRGWLPAWLGHVHPVRRTPLAATAVAWAIITVLASAFPVIRLAGWTAQIMLAVFSLVCLSLILVKLRGEPAPEGTFIAPLPVVIAGAAVCLMLLMTSF